MNSGSWVPGALLALSVVSHSLFLIVPWPEASTPEMPAAAGDSPDDMAVVVLPKIEDEPLAVALTPAGATPPAAEAAKATETLLQTTVNPETTAPVPPAAVNPPPPVPPQASDPVPEPAPLPDNPPGVDDLPLADEGTPAYSDPSPIATGPLVAYTNTFPHFEGAAAGCFGFQECRRVSGAGSYRNVARSLIAGLEAQGYQVKLRDDLEDTGRNVYELSTPDTSELKYLMVFSDSDGSAVYVMSTEIMTLNDLQTLQVQSGGSNQTS